MALSGRKYICRGRLREEDGEEVEREEEAALVEVVHGCSVDVGFPLACCVSLGGGSSYRSG